MRQQVTPYELCLLKQSLNSYTVQASPSGWVYHLVLNAPKPRGVASSKGEKTLENEVTNEK